MNKTVEFLDSIARVQALPIPDPVMARAKQSLLDYLAVTSAGAQFQREKIDQYMTFSQPEPGNFTAIGTGRKCAIKESVFLNGLNGHALDFDDGTNSGIIHLGSPIFSLLLPLAQRYDFTVDQVLRAAVIGYETSYTMAISIQPGHKALGFHATGTCGVLGATIAASYLLGFSQEERFQAFATACVSATGMLSVLDDGSELKPYNVAKTALLALTSIQLAKAGFKGHPDPLGGSRGYFKMMTGSVEAQMEPVLKNGTYAISKTYTKPYASCRYTHPSVEAAIALRNVHGLTVENIEQVNIKTYSLAVSGHDHVFIPSTYSAKMSIPFATAMGVIFGKAGIQEFSDENIRNKQYLSLTEKIHVSADPELSRIFPEVQAAVVDIRTTDGRSFSQRVDFPKGEPENPLTEQEFFDRYLGLMDYSGLARQTGVQVYDLAHEGSTAVREILELL